MVGTYNKDVIAKNQAHILASYDDPQDFVSDVESMMRNLAYEHKDTPYNAIQALARNGEFGDAYYEDQRNWIVNGLKVPQNRKYTDKETSDLYCSLMARDGIKLYESLKEQKKATAYSGTKYGKRTADGFTILEAYQSPYDGTIYVIADTGSDGYVLGRGYMPESGFWVGGVYASDNRMSLNDLRKQAGAWGTLVYKAPQKKTAKKTASKKASSSASKSADVKSRLKAGKGKLLAAKSSKKGKGAKR